MLQALPNIPRQPLIQILEPIVQYIEYQWHFIQAKRLWEMISSESAVGRSREFVLIIPK